MITDASFSKVKGKTYAGWAAWLRVDGISEPIKRGGAITRVPVQNSTTAEVFAAVNGVYLAKHYGATRILLQTDCLAVVAAINGTARPGAPTSALVSAAMGHAGIENVLVQARHVKGHTNDPAARSWVNRWCDSEAKRHMRRVRGSNG